MLWLLAAGCTRQACPVPPPADVPIRLSVEAHGSRGTPLDAQWQIPDLGFFCAYTGGQPWDAALHAPDKAFDRRMVRDPVSNQWTDASDPQVRWEPAATLDNYSLFAYAPYATGANGIEVISSPLDAGPPRLRYRVPAQVHAQPDLMVAVPRYDLHATGHPVPMQMRHALTAIDFRLFGTGERITAARLLGIRGSGELAVDGEQLLWDVLDEPPGSYEAGIAFDAGESHFTAGTLRNLLAGDGYLMMIPQPLDAQALIEVDITGQPSRRFPLEHFAWHPGERVAYDLYLSVEPSVRLTPDPVVLTGKSHAPAPQTLQVACALSDGRVADSLAWRLVSSAAWLTLSPTDHPASALDTVCGIGPQTLYLFTRPNPSITSRSTTICWNGTPICEVVQQGH